MSCLGGLNCILLVLVFLLAIISTPLSGNWIKNTLAIHPNEDSATPIVAIFVLAGGYQAGATSDEDVLGAERFFVTNWPALMLEEAWPIPMSTVEHPGELWNMLLSIKT